VVLVKGIRRPRAAHRARQRAAGRRINNQ
jgi:hypothetical protein